MRSPGINGEGELRGQPANPGSPGKIAVKTVCVCVCVCKDEAGGGDNWSYKTCKAPVKSSPPTNQHQTFYRPDALLVAQPTVSKH